jgi:hypothetical protein
LENSRQNNNRSFNVSNPSNPHRRVKDLQLTTTDVITRYLNPDHPTPENPNILTPSPIRYGRGAHDTYPRDLDGINTQFFEHLGEHSIRTSEGGIYTCNLTASWTDAITDLWTADWVSWFPPRRGGFLERRVFGLSSMVCWDEDGEMKDVVRDLV